MFASTRAKFPKGGRDLTAARLTAGGGGRPAPDARDVRGGAAGGRAPPRRAAAGPGGQRGSRRAAAAGAWRPARVTPSALPGAGGGAAGRPLRATREPTFAAPRRESESGGTGVSLVPAGNAQRSARRRRARARGVRDESNCRYRATCPWTGAAVRGLPRLTFAADWGLGDGVPDPAPGAARAARKQPPKFKE